MRFQVRQCLSETCHFRFPVPDNTPSADYCPRCGSPTVISIDQYPDLRVDPAAKPAASKREIIGFLDNIRSTFNVGAMFRSADGAGLVKMVLCGMTATPENPKVAKTALGAEFSTPWQYSPNSLDAAQRLLNQGVELWALEGGRSSVSLFDARQSPSTRPLALIVGNELAGVDPGLLEMCSQVVHLPMQGFKASLNAAVAFSISIYLLIE